MSTKQAAQRACKRIIKAEGAREIAELLGISTQAVYKWRVIPQNRVEALRNAFAYTTVELRPDL